LQSKLRGFIWIKLFQLIILFQIVFAVSYFFDKDHYEDPEAFSKIAPDVQLHNYVACGLVAYNLRTRAMKWQLHLDLTTDLTKFRAFVYNSPVLADLDGDGKLEILLGTSVGFIYVVNSDGKVRKGFPLQMGEIQASIAVHDLNGDGQLEIIAADSRHNIAVFHSNGDNLWHRHVSGFVSRSECILTSYFSFFCADFLCTVVLPSETSMETAKWTWWLPPTAVSFGFLMAQLEIPSPIFLSKPVDPYWPQ
jgi:hypothetical protein